MYGMKTKKFEILEERNRVKAPEYDYRQGKSVCRQCNNEIDGITNFCSRCGQRLKSQK